MPSAQAVGEYEPGEPESTDLVSVTRTAMMLDGTRNMDSSATEMINAMHPLGGVGEATSVAKAALVLASDDVDWITGVNLPVDGGYVAQ